MALIKCAECGQDVSSLAASCVHCGFPIADKVREDQGKKAAAAEMDKNKALAAIEMQRERIRGIIILVFAASATLLAAWFLFRD